MNVIFDHPSGRVALIHGMALETLRQLPAKSVDMILTDPPYGAHVHANLGKERRDDGRAPRDALVFPPITDAAIRELAAEFVRVCRGWILVFSDFYSSATWGKAIESAGGAWVRMGQWCKTNPMPQMTGDRPGCGAEDIVIGHATGEGLAWNGGGHSNIWRGPREHAAEHPTQKPTWLIQALLGAFAPAGALVLDPFIGSGTTAYAALLTERVRGEVPIETTCAKCVDKRAAEWSAPLPQGVRVLGIEGDERWTNHTIARIAPLLAA